MWILLLIFLNNASVSSQAIFSYATLKTCEDERIRITAEFDKAYPVEERNYKFECIPARRLHE